MHLLHFISWFDNNFINFFGFKTIKSIFIGSIFGLILVYFIRFYSLASNGIKSGYLKIIDRVKEVVNAAKNNGCSIRIGVNAGSLEKNILDKYGSPCPEAMVESALMHESILQDQSFDQYKISVKASDVLLTMESYKQLSKVTKAPLHLGVTEAGGLMSGSIKSSIGIGQLLLDGIGDTIRVSLSADPVEENKCWI